jgi:hypothetical protein
LSSNAAFVRTVSYELGVNPRLADSVNAAVFIPLDTAMTSFLARVAGQSPLSDLPAHVLTHMLLDPLLAHVVRCAAPDAQAESPMARDDIAGIFARIFLFGVVSLDDNRHDLEPARDQIIEMFRRIFFPEVRT